jgi:hypothetical protein
VRERAADRLRREVHEHVAAEDQVEGPVGHRIEQVVLGEARRIADPGVDLDPPFGARYGAEGRVQKRPRRPARPGAIVALAGDGEVAGEEVRAEHLDPDGGVGRQRIEQAGRDGVGLLAGGAARAPGEDALRLSRDQLRHHGPRHELEVLGVAEEVGLAHRDRLAEGVRDLVLARLGAREQLCGAHVAQELCRGPADRLGEDGLVGKAGERGRTQGQLPDQDVGRHCDHATSFACSA